MKDKHEHPEAITPQVERRRADRYRSGGAFSPVTALFIAVGVLIVGLIAFFGIQILSQSNELPPGPTTHTSSTSGSSKGGNDGTLTSKGSSPWEDQEFVSTVMNYTAGKLHLSLGELTARVQAGAQFRDVATQQGISAAQVRTIELAALQLGLQKLISTNRIVQALANIDRENWQKRDQVQLDEDFTLALGGTPTVPKNLLTPTVK